MPSKRARSETETEPPAKRTRATRSSARAQAANAETSTSPAKTQAQPKVRQSKAKAEPKAETKPAPSRNTPAKPAKATKATKAAERDESERCYWLMKAEPESRLENGVDVRFSIDDLAARNEPEPWDGVRNPVAQKNMRNMRKSEMAFFYHSNCKVPGIAGVMRIVQEQSTDESAFDPKHPYYDAKSKRDAPRWIVVHVEFVKKFDAFVPLKKLQEHAKSGDPLENLQTLRLSRLSVSQVRPEEWEFVLGLAGVDEQDRKGLA